MSKVLIPVSQETFNCYKPILVNKDGKYVSLDKDEFKKYLKDNTDESVFVYSLVSILTPKEIESEDDDCCADDDEEAPILNKSELFLKEFENLLKKYI